MWMLLTAFILTGCNKTEQITANVYKPTKEDLSYALPQIGEAAILEAQIQAGSKGTITVATVGSPNTEILQEAAKILGEKGWLLKIEVCEDYLTPNQLVAEGKVDCNYYQHKAFLDRYNIEKQTQLLEYAKIHYEPMAVFSEKVDQIQKVTKGAKVLVPENATALAQALFLLQEKGLLTLMEDADLTAVMDDILDNPMDLELVVCPEDEMFQKLGENELAVCHKSYATKAGKEAEGILLAEEGKDSLAAQSLSQGIVINGTNTENVDMLVEVLMSGQMQQFIRSRYHDTIYMMDGKCADFEEVLVEEEVENPTEEISDSE